MVLMINRGFGLKGADLVINLIKRFYAPILGYMFILWCCIMCNDLGIETKSSNDVGYGLSAKFLEYFSPINAEVFP